MQVVKLAKHYVAWIAVVALVGLYGATTGCLADPPPPVGGSAAVEQSVLDEAGGAARPEVVCPVCPAPRGIPAPRALGGPITEACSCASCGNGVCDAGETAQSCPFDCVSGGGGGGGGGGPRCGNHICEGGENLSCPIDCCPTAQPCPNPP